MSDEHETVIPAMPTYNPAYSLSRVEIRFHGELDHDGKGEWGDAYTEAMRITGLEYKTLRDYASVSAKVQLSLRNDNLAYELHKKVASLKDEPEQKMEISYLGESMTITGLDQKTLEMYSRVARDVQLETRVSNLSFEHHCKVAAIKEPGEQQKWLRMAGKHANKGKPISSRRLAKSILLGRLAKESDMETERLGYMFQDMQKAVDIRDEISEVYAQRMREESEAR